MHVYGTQKYCNCRLYTYFKLQQKHVHVRSSILPCTPEGLAEIRDRAKAKRRQEEGVSMEECPDKEAAVRGEVCVVYTSCGAALSVHVLSHTHLFRCTHIIVHVHTFCCTHTSCCRHVHFVAHILLHLHIKRYRYYVNHCSSVPFFFFFSLVMERRSRRRRKGERTKWREKGRRPLFLSWRTTGAMKYM